MPVDVWPEEGPFGLMPVDVWPERRGGSDVPPTDVSDIRSPSSGKAVIGDGSQPSRENLSEPSTGVLAAVETHARLIVMETARRCAVSALLETVNSGTANEIL